ncbi:MAG: hypothetical protein E6F96_01170 [Actinobacteria bacterium]|nr:MAG: hypothetical protein E6F96_01170 [Actinomycetota bacterium]
MPRRIISLVPTTGVAVLAVAGLLAVVPTTSVGLQMGIGDNNPKMFGNPYYRLLHTTISRYVAPYDVADRPSDLAAVNAWISAAEAQHVEPLIAFYHSRSQPNNQLPGVARYALEIKRFITFHPQITVYSAWNEANRGTAPAPGDGSIRGPSPSQSAGYYLALKRACPRCTIVGLDVLDSTNVASTVRYIHAFQRDVHGQLPSIWGLHNYSDTNRFRNQGTKAVLAAVRGQVWLTETGGVVKFGSEFPNRYGSGLKRAKRAIAYAFKLAESNRRITRLYIFAWFGVANTARFDAGLMDSHGKPRPSYAVVREHLTSN